MPQEAIKSAPNITKLKVVLHDILTDGDQTEIAGMFGLSHQCVSQRFSTGSQTKPSLYEGLREAWAISCVNPEAGWKLKAYVDGLFDSWLSPVQATEKNLTALIRDAQENMTALVSAKLDNKPLAELREEGRAARGAIDQLLAALDLEFELRSTAPKIAGK